MTDAQIAKLARIQACYVETVALQAEGGRLMNLEEVSAHSGTQAEMMLRNASRADYDRWEAAAENSNMSLPDFIFKAAADRADLCLEPEATP